MGLSLGKLTPHQLMYLGDDKHGDCLSLPDASHAVRTLGELAKDLPGTTLVWPKVTVYRVACASRISLRAFLI